MLIAKTRNAFTTQLYRRDGEQIGAITIAPWLGAPRNGRLRGGKDDVATLALRGRTYRLEWEVLPDTPGRRGVRWWLMDGDAPLASATARTGGRRRRWDVDIAGQRFALVPRGSWLRRDVDLLRQEGTKVGAVTDTTRLLALARTYALSGPADLDEAAQGFLLHLATRAMR